MMCVPRRYTEKETRYSTGQEVQDRRKERKIEVAYGNIPTWY